jgi:uncharacterized membrane protein
LSSEAILSKKNKPFYSLQVNQPPKPSFIPSNLSQQVLGHGQPSLVAVETTHSTTLSGPIPPPEIIGGYEKVLVGSADRIIKMAEKEQNHRHLLQLRSQRHQAVITVFGQICAFVLGLSGIAGGVFLLIHDKPITGFGVFFTSLASLIGLFFYNRNRQNASPTAK